jgi:hypothetical protein
MIKKGEKGGQVAIFIIIAILIVALAVLLYLYWPKLFPSTSPQTKNPATYIDNCMQEKIQDTVKAISLQGGDYITTENNGYFYKKEGEDTGVYVRYLCYTNEDFVHCFNQEPFLTEHIQSEILNEITPSITNCFNSMKEAYAKQGYEVNLKDGNPTVQIIPKSISTNFNRTLTLIKGKESQRYSNFEVNLNSNLYDLVEVSKNILIWEMRAGDSMPEAYMYNNPSLKIEKHLKDDNVKVYSLTDGDTKEVFEFAVRSMAAPIGF